MTGTWWERARRFCYGCQVQCVHLFCMPLFHSVGFCLPGTRDMSHSLEISLSLSLSRFVLISVVLFGISLVVLRCLLICWDLFRFVGISLVVLRSLSLLLSLSLSLSLISRQDKYLQYVRQSYQKRRTFSCTIYGKGPIQETY